MRTVEVSSVSLRTEENALVVSVTVDGDEVELMREPWTIEPDDGSIWTTVTALGIAGAAKGRAV